LRIIKALIFATGICLALAIGGFGQVKKTAPAGTKKKAPTAMKSYSSSAKKSSAPAKRRTTTRASSSRPSTTKKTASRTTTRKPAAAPKPRAQANPTSERYTQIQQALAEKGYYTGAVDGSWSPSSIEALKRFQRDQNITADGKLGALSLIALGLGPKRDPLPPTSRMLGKPDLNPTGIQ